MFTVKTLRALPTCALWYLVCVRSISLLCAFLRLTILCAVSGAHGSWNFLEFILGKTVGTLSVCYLINCSKTVASFVYGAAVL